MKNTLKKVLALLMALMLFVPSLAFATEVEEDICEGFEAESTEAVADFVSEDAPAAVALPAAPAEDEDEEDAEKQESAEEAEEPAESEEKDEDAEEAKDVEEDKDAEESENPEETDENLVEEFELEQVEEDGIVLESGSWEAAASYEEELIEGEEAAYTVGDNNDVAKIDDAGYATLQAAVDAAENGNTITLLHQVTTGATIPIGKTVTIDLNKNEINTSSGNALLNMGNLTVTGSGNVITTAGGSAAVANVPGGTVTLSGGTYRSDKWYTIKNLGTMTIDGQVTVEKSAGNDDTSSLIANGWYGSADTVGGKSYTAEANKASLEIKSGTFTGRGGAKSCSVIKNDDYGTLTITGGTFDSTNNTGNSDAATLLNFGTSTISGGTFIGQYPISNGYYGTAADPCQITITGGMFESVSTSKYLLGSGGGTADGSAKSQLTIKGGVFKGYLSNTRKYKVVVYKGPLFTQPIDEYIDIDENGDICLPSLENEGYYCIRKPLVTFDADNGTPAPTDQEVGVEQTVTKPAAPSKTGYTFLHWYDPDAQEEYDFSKPVTKDLHLVALYDVNEYTITFKDTGDSTIKPITLPYGMEITKPADPTRAGYTFAGWEPAIPAAMPAENLTITAKWTENPAPAPAPAPAPVVMIPALKKTSKTTLTAAPGETFPINTNGKTAKKFKSSNKKVATVDQYGNVTVKKAGKTKITMKVGKKKRTVTLKIVDPTVPKKVTLNLSGTVAAAKGDTVSLTATIPAGTNSAIKWKSSNKKVATVSKDGVVTFKKKGKVTITATAARGKKKAKVKFKVGK